METFIELFPTVCILLITTGILIKVALINEKIPPPQRCRLIQNHNVGIGMIHHKGLSDGDILIILHYLIYDGQLCAICKKPYGNKIYTYKAKQVELIEPDQWN